MILWLINSLPTYAQKSTGIILPSLANISNLVVILESIKVCPDGPVVES